MILCLTGGTHSVTAPASGIRAFNCWSALTLSNQARVEQSKERVLPWQIENSFLFWPANEKMFQTSSSGWLKETILTSIQAAEHRCHVIHLNFIWSLFHAQESQPGVGREWRGSWWRCCQSVPSQIPPERPNLTSFPFLEKVFFRLKVL